MNGRNKKIMSDRQGLQKQKLFKIERTISVFSIFLNKTQYKKGNNIKLDHLKREPKGTPRNEKGNQKQNIMEKLNRRLGISEENINKLENRSK